MKEQKKPFKVVEKDDVEKLKEQKKRIQAVMEIIKDEWLEDDKEFMKEVYDAIGSALK